MMLRKMEELDEYRQLLQPEGYLLYKYPKKVKPTLENTLRYLTGRNSSLSSGIKLLKPLRPAMKDNGYAIYTIL
jgi:hypothetical protein